MRVQILIGFVFIFGFFSVLNAQSPKHSFAIETITDNYKEANSFSNQNTTFAEAENTFGYQIGLNYTYRLPKNWFVSSKLAWGMQTHRFVYWFDLRAISDYPFRNERDIFREIGVGIDRPHSFLNFSVGKRINLPENWFVEANLGIDLRLYLMNTGFVAPRTEIFIYQNQDTTFARKYAEANLFFEGGKLNNLNLLYTGELKVGQSFNNKHAFYLILGLKHNVGVRQAQEKAEFKFYKNNTELIGRSTYYNFQRQFNFGLGYQLSF